MAEKTSVQSVKSAPSTTLPTTLPIVVPFDPSQIVAIGANKPANHTTMMYVTQDNTRVDQVAVNQVNQVAVNQVAVNHSALFYFAMLVEKLDPEAHIPTKASEDDAGYDLYAFEPATVPVWGSYLVKTKIKLALPIGVYGRIASRSGLALKHNIEVGAGVVDRNYRGEICVLLRNFSGVPYEIKKGDRIAQMIITPYRSVQVEETENLADSSRGTGGFGSSGR